MRRPRDLSAEERALWDSVSKQAKPLRKKRRSIAPATKLSLHQEPRTPDPSPPQERGEGRRQCSGSPPPILHGGEGSGVGGPPSKLSEQKSPSSPTHPIDRRERTRLARGHREIDARIDLHGMTQARAHRVLLAFLRSAQADGCRYVLVITGKGKILSDGSERGVLRRQVPEWLGLPEFRALVTGYKEASIGHGGAGALYVRVRRG